MPDFTKSMSIYNMTICISKENSSSKVSVSGAKLVLGWFHHIVLCWFRVENCLEAIIKVIDLPHTSHSSTEL